MVVTTFMLQFLVSPNRSFARDVSTMPALLYPLSQGDYADVAQAILRAIVHSLQSTCNGAQRPSNTLTGDPLISQPRPFGILPIGVAVLIPLQQVPGTDQEVRRLVKPLEKALKLSFFFRATKGPG